MWQPKVSRIGENNTQFHHRPHAACTTDCTQDDHRLHASTKECTARRITGGTARRIQAAITDGIIAELQGYMQHCRARAEH